MPRKIGLLAASALLTLAVSNVRAGAVHIGMVACNDCTEIVDLSEPNLFAFLVGPPDTINEPDVLLDERSTGGITIGGTDVSGTLWAVPLNWRDIFVPGPSVFVVVINQGTIVVDSSDFPVTDLGLETPQVLCSFPGGMAPRVTRAAGDRVVEWASLVELNDAQVPNGCAVGGVTVRGHIIGYDIYRLDAGGVIEPPRRQFVTDGFLAHVDLSQLDFGVADPDGSSGSDLDATDGLKLRNPDGVPDTGDEILMFTDAGAAAGDFWYRIQPVVAGSQSFYETGMSSFGVPATRVDLTGDGILDSVDIGRDGYIDFIDPSGRGLGLTWGGEIASSFLAGRAEPEALVPDCDGRPPVLPAEDCDNGRDDDGDGLADCLDLVECCADPACAAPPAEIARLRVAKAAVGSSDARVSWTPTAMSDLLSGCLCRRISAPDPRAPGCLWQDRSTVAASCLADDETAFSFTDARAIDPTTVGTHYLVREQSPCGGAGTFGTDSRGSARVLGPASCSP